LTEPTDPIVLDGVGKSYSKDGTLVVEDLSLTIRRGEFFCLIGASGCGKSTVVKMIAGIERPTKGVVRVSGRIGMVFQSYALLPWLTVEDNVAFAARMQGWPKAKVEEICETYLAMVHLREFARRYPRELSGGQRQRVGLARALAIEPDILLMDEPFSALDPIITDELHDEVLRIWGETGKTIVLVSHHFEEAVLLADRVGIIRQGRLEQVVPIDLARPRHDEDPAFIAETHRLRGYLAPKAEAEAP
jgi:NitT/TauT family transport system ATP-binding protein